MRLPGFESTRRLLVVDDDVRLARIIGDVFRRASWEVDVAHDLSEARSLANAARPTHCTLDQNLGSGSAGLDLMSKAGPGDWLPPITVLVSGQLNFELSSQAAELPIRWIFPKPVRGDDLLQQMIRLSRRADDAAGQLADRAGLTPSEKRTFFGRLNGATNKELAHLFGVTAGTVRMHLSKIYAKCEVNGFTELVMRIQAAA